MNTRFGRSEILLVALSTGLALTLLMSGCAKQVDSNANSFTQVYNASFAVSCQNCHAPGGSHSFMDFTSADAAYNSLVGQNVTSPANPSTCGGIKRVAAGSSANSYLLAVLSQRDNSPNFGGSTNCQAPTTHHALVNLTDAERSSIISWIDAGAAR